MNTGNGNSGDVAADPHEDAGLTQRPHIANQCGRLGNWEGDLVLDRNGSSGLLTLTDPQIALCYVLLRKVRINHADRVHRNARHALRGVIAGQRHSITFDNDIEFTDWNTNIFRRSRLSVPAWYERKHDGLIRQTFPKGIDFRTITPHDVQQIERLMNHRPRRCLRFLTQAEVFPDTPPSQIAIHVEDR